MTGYRSAFGLVTALLLPSVLVAVAAGPAEASACGSLSVTQSAAPGGDLANAAFVSAAESWAVGTVGSSQHPGQTLIERFDGSAWSVVPSPDQGTANNSLNGVSMIPGAGWAVGYYQVGNTYQPLALRWDGAQWSLNSPSAFPDDTVFTSVDTLADGSAWAVGFQTSADGNRQTLIENAPAGGPWTPGPSLNAAGSADNTLMAIGGTSATGLWAVGYFLSPHGLKPLLLRYNTALRTPRWVRLGKVPSPGTVETVLTGVDALAPNDAWAVGYYDNGGGKQPLALHWDGTNWASSPVPGTGILRKVRETGPDNVWATGTYYDAALGRYQTLVEHFDGTSWSPVVSADARSDNEIIGLAMDPDGTTMTLVGRAGPNPLIEQAGCASGPIALPGTAPAPIPPVSPAPGVGPAPSPPPDTPAPTTPVPVTITDNAAAAGIAGTDDWSFSAAVGDYGAGAGPDLFVSHHWHPANLWLNNSDGTFSPANVSYFGSIVDRHDCLAADVNSDGLQDIFCSVGADRGTAIKSSALYIQQPDHTFADEAQQWNVSDPAGRGRWSTVLDANNDSYPDIFYGADPLRPDGLPSMDRFYLNTGQNSFVDDPAMGLDLNMGALCAHTVDYNRDGWPDLLVCGQYGLRLFENEQGGGFTDVSSILGPSVKVLDAAMADVNHDNLPDLITVTTNQVQEFVQRPDGTFAPPVTILKKIKNGASLAVGDVNGDNNPDIYIVGGRSAGQNAPDYLLLGDATGGFGSAAIPETTVGDGEEAYPIDYNHSGLTSFLVLNGEVPYSGPVQLLTPSASSFGAVSRSASMQR